MEMQETLAKYLAGLLDADGTLAFRFTAYKGEYYLSLAISLGASEAVDKHGFVESLPEITGFGSVSKGCTNKSEKPFYTWTVAARAHVEMLLPRLIKHMVVKAQYWDWLLGQWRELRSGRISEATKHQLAEESKHYRAEKVGPIKPKNHPTWAWLAGYLDGNGCYDFRTQKDGHRRMAIRVCSHVNDESVLDFIQNAMGGRRYPHSCPNAKEWHRCLGPSNKAFAVPFLQKMAQHSHLKKWKIEQMLAYLHAY